MHQKMPFKTTNSIFFSGREHSCLPSPYPQYPSPQTSYLPMPLQKQWLKMMWWHLQNINKLWLILPRQCYLWPVRDSNLQACPEMQTQLHTVIPSAVQQAVGWLEFNIPFQHKYSYIRDVQQSMHSVFTLLSIICQNNICFKNHSDKYWILYECNTQCPQCDNKIQWYAMAVLVRYRYHNVGSTRLQRTAYSLIMRSVDC